MTFSHVRSISPGKGSEFPAKFTAHSWYALVIRFLFFSLLSFAAALSSLRAESYIKLSIPPHAKPANQLTHSRKSCAPAALLNALKFGSPSHQNAYGRLLGDDDSSRLHYLVDRFFGRPSTHLDGVPRFTPQGGCTRLDLAAAYRDAASEFALPEIQHREWLRKQGETSTAFVARVHHDLRRSIKWQTPPLIEFRSQTAQWEEKEQRWRWRSQADHYVTVTGVPDQLPSGALGFPFHYIDPDGGKFATGFIHAETRQSFAAFSGEMVHGRWLGGNRFLLVTAPESASLISPEKTPWHTRSLIVLSYFIGG